MLIFLAVTLYDFENNYFVYCNTFCIMATKKKFGCVSALLGVLIVFSLSP